jgi:hypothetical protein
MAIERHIWRMKVFSDLRNRKKREQSIKKLYSITKSCSKPYFNKILIDLFNHNTENANAICDYLISEETEINIKNSTKEGRIIY